MISLALLTVCLAMLWHYIRAGRAATKSLRTRQGPWNRRHFLRQRLIAQWRTMVLVPGAALWLSGLLTRGFHPAAAANAAAAMARSMLGVSRADITAFVPTWTGVAGLGVLIVVLEAIPIVLGWKRRLVLGDFSALLPQSPAELPYAAALAVGAGFGEELLFRAEIPAALAHAGIPLQVGLILSLIIFAGCHLYQGWIGVLAVTFAGLLLTALYVISGSLWVAIAFHIAIDVIALVLRPAAGMGMRRLIGARGIARNRQG